MIGITNLTIVNTDRYLGALCARHRGWRSTRRENNLFAISQDIFASKSIFEMAPRIFLLPMASWK